jgi:tRNA(Leu) C34 or U34 (ribose-2'-O)-methylase TrmL
MNTTQRRMQSLKAKARPVPETPAVALINPKFAHNIGTVLRACSCFNVRQLWWTGDRVPLDIDKGQRLPREERMKGYEDVEMVRDDRFFDAFGRDVTPVAVEVRPGSENLLRFEHPERALYVFGPEDGSIPKPTLMHCHRFVIIPSRHCLNLASAVYVVLYDRLIKRYRDGLEAVEDYALAEHRGFIEDGSGVFVGISEAGLGRGHAAHRGVRR